MLKKIATSIGVTGTAVALLVGTASATIVTHSTLTTKQQATGQGSKRNYNIYTGTSGARWSKLQLNKVGAAYTPSFTVQSAYSAHGWIYPNIGAGAERGMRPPYTWSPVRARSMGSVNLRTTTTLQHRRSDSYNAGWDVWFETWADRSGNQQSYGGTEIMIWTAAVRNGRWIYYGPGRYLGRFRADGITWNVNASIATAHGHSWHRIYFTAVTPHTGFNGQLNPFVSKAVRVGYLSLSEYLTGAEFGFEINRGGAGLAVKSLSITGVR
jgi:hypothetical protein